MKDILEPKSFAYEFAPVEHILTQEQLFEIIKLLKELKYIDYRVLKNTDDTSTFRFQCILHYNIFDEMAENKVRMIREKLYGFNSAKKKKYIWTDVDWIEEVFLSIGFCSSYIVLKDENFLEMKNIGNALLNINYEPMYKNSGFVCVHIPCCNGYRIKAAKIEEYLFRSNIPFCMVSDYDGFLHFHELREYDVSFKSNVGFREDLKLIMNSSWESNMARIFNFKSIPFEYEKQSFILKDNDSKRSYKPDFFLANNLIVEVKGFWDIDSLKKVSLFKEQYPEYDLKIIDQDMFSHLAQLYENKISQWEACETKIKSEKVYVVGVQRLERKKAVSEVKEWDEIHLVREPDNPYDKNAIAVYNKNKEQLGYIRRDFASVYAEKMDLGFIYKAIVFKKDKSSLTVKLTRINLDKIIVYDFIK